MLLNLAERDLVALDIRRDLRLAYPFTESVTGHRIIMGDHALNSLCAIDALGTGDMYLTDVRVQSACRFSSEPIEITTRSNGKEVTPSLLPIAALALTCIKYRSPMPGQFAHYLSEGSPSEIQLDRLRRHR